MINKNNGQTLETEEQSIQQSIDDIVSTPIGSRIMRREYGSLIPDLIDQPINEVLILKCYSAIYTAILRWEDRINVSQILNTQVKENGLIFDLEGTSTVTGQNMNLRIPLKMGASS
ncbi:GPW/gp25 family protein [Acinetobacter baumannii]|uniref:GPW/gp25 family protein n=1 Tax=Acinetobacter calcoaceticus/baumannii complex TaxID=909768 RepID=UPI00070A3508|nr:MULTISPECIES: GPW/gp25 family protein [Acinetobacter calcoaceticus/baumannii complex]EHT1074219.1 GPW/gp25 family protein [Acinetobacter baumannii]KRJ31917.1 baseplate assembly protein [Acinetobacter baumannii]MBY8899556.1 GPW/gp25 family protein [Acinetobacter baumannii]MBY8906826.1 GPW/gp25 family protein [Acinetobacter baumannii]MCZ3296078.1 GPW/gp25 family protein [Acinetobacter baumannii]